MDEPSLDTSPSPSAAPAALGAFGGSTGIGWRHSLVVLEGQQPGRRIDIDERPLVIGRRASADLVLPELQVSGLHCRLRAEAGQPALKVTDLQSTNGSFINGQRIAGSAYLAPGDRLTVGDHVFRHDLLSPESPEPPERAAGEDAREAAEPAQTLPAWLPAPGVQGAVRVACCHHTADPPRGAGLAVLPLSGDRVAFVALDVTGPPEQVAQHAARLLQALREWDDASAPAGVADVLLRLRERWRFDPPAGLSLCAWAGVYDVDSGILQHASAGHPAALLRLPDGEMLRLEVPNPAVDLLPDAALAEAACTVLPGSRLYLFNRGAFDVQDRAGRPLTLDDFEALVACRPVTEDPTPDDLFAELRQQTGAAALADDFLLLRADFS
jgi:sigma-B regulation protein RsbU (phosphoserine phosphatase)